MYRQVMEMMWKRMSDAHWRHSFKGMELLHFLLLNGHVRCIDEARSRIKMLQGMAIATCPRERDHGEFDPGGWGAIHPICASLLRWLFLSHLFLRFS